MALEPRRVERWLRDAYPTQQVHDRVEWHAEGAMVQCFVRLDDRVVLVHLEGEGERTVLKGRLEIPLDLWKPGSTQATPSPRAGIRFRHRTNEITFSNRAGRAPEYGRNLVERWLAEMRTDMTQPRTQTQQLSGLRASLTRVSKQLETATLEPAKKELDEIKASLERSEFDLGRALGELSLIHISEPTRPY